VVNCSKKFMSNNFNEIRIVFSLDFVHQQKHHGREILNFFLINSFFLVSH
jgi:hypothetical protein